MISDYLFQVYVNCKALSTTPAFKEEECRGNFKKALQELCTSLDLASEKELQNTLVQLKQDGVGALLDRHPFLEIFYLINSLDELSADENNFDALGRFQYAFSYQKLNNLAPNRVLDIIHESCKTIPFLKSSFIPSPKPSRFFLSHDIDSLYGSTVQDGLWAIKHLRPDVLLKLIANVILQRPHWFNIDQIMDLESEYDFRSTFYWLVNKGRIDKRQTNSDYSISSPKLKASLSRVAARGFENGLHKSISPQSLKEEAALLATNPIGNRYHYLKFKLPNAYQAIQDSGLKLDASLGFAEKFGFRNAYSFPFSPYNFETGEAFDFLEVPLTLMDGTFQRYMKVPVEKTARQIIEFIEKNKQNALISILWHNTFFTNYKYKGYLQEYKKILAYLHESKFTCMTQVDLLNHYSWKKN